ncbi:zf-HC2 domain-containing protein [Leptolyngbya sp. FACHB-17]|uniref:anti-sigma factor family protein n=2 Tax=unclassified Leptolyngbya TaxID=2650499 RepID=UPI0016803DA8|nr:zf-HC2 domain-containing protein [Leptolyngbya sp. FACHB-17]
MNSNFDSLNNAMQPLPDSQLNARDRFELLSAYLDGEVTASERKQVEEWLSTDASVQQLHARLLKLRQAFRSMPAPAPSQPVETTVDQVLAKVDRRPKLRWVWGGAAIAAAFMGAVSLFSVRQAQFAKVNPPQQPTVQAQQQPASEVTGGMMVALDRPVVSIKAADTSKQRN